MRDNRNHADMKNRKWQQVYAVVLIEKTNRIDFRSDISYTIIKFNRSTTGKSKEKRYYYESDQEY